MARIVVGMSGGVDSSVAAHLLKSQGHEVIGLFMKNWHDEGVTISNECPWLEDSNDAMIVAQQLGIPFQTIDLSEAYKAKIVDYMFAEYQRGKTPNPDVLCNREIKFDVFLKAALDLGADYVATGHYCRKDTIEVNGKPIHRLLAGKDNNKDQSYFLCQLSQEQLEKALFPIGELTKPQVREIADEIGLVNADKKDSQGLCFVGKIKLPEFLQQQLLPKKGDIVEIDNNYKGYDLSLLYNGFKDNYTKEDLIALTQPYIYNKLDGKIKGQHNGAHYFTIGQRKGLQVGGSPLPLFVIETDTIENNVYVGQGEDHPGLLRKGLFIATSDVHSIRPDLALAIGENRLYEARIRYRQPLSNVKIFCEEDGYYLIFDQAQKGVAPGQFATWYKGDELIGSGIIA